MVEMRRMWRTQLIQSNTKKRDGGGRPETKRYKNGNEKPSGKKKTECSFCGKTDSHRVNGCPDRRKIGPLYRTDMIDQLVQDLAQRNSPVLETVVIPEGANTFEQLDSATQFIVIHSYASCKDTNGGLSQDVAREDMNFLCVTPVFKYGIINERNKKCYVKTSQVTSWITKTQKNRKSVICSQTI